MPVVGSSTVFDNSTQSNDPSFTFSHNHAGGTGAALLVLVAIMSDVTGSSDYDLTVDYDGAAMTERVINNNSQYTAFAGSVRAFYIQDPNTGNNDVDISVTADNETRAFLAVAIDLTQAGGFGNDAGDDRGGNSGDTSFDYDINASSADSLLIGMHTVRGAGRSFSPGSGYTELTEGDTGGSTATDFSYIVQHKIAGDTGNEAFDGSWSPNNRNQGGVVEILPSSTDVLASGEGEAVSSGDADTLVLSYGQGTGTGVSSSDGDAFIIYPEDVGTAVSSGEADPGVLSFGSGEGDAVSSGEARGVRLIFADATGTAATIGEANGQGNVLASATGDAVSESSGFANEFAGVRGTGESTSSGEANALPPVAIIPQAPIEDSFAGGQRPVILFDLFFDSGELNIWTRPHVGEFRQRPYVPLAGITDGVTIRNSLDDNSFEAAIEFAGQSEELLAISLTENYQGRRANVVLANLGADGQIEAIETLLLGRIINMAIVDDQNESSVAILIESIFKDINRPLPIRQSTADLEATSPDDSFFEFLDTVAISEPQFGGTS